MMRHAWQPKHREPVTCRCSADMHDADCEAAPLIGQTDWGRLTAALGLLFLAVVLLHG